MASVLQRVWRAVAGGAPARGATRTDVERVLTDEVVAAARPGPLVGGMDGAASSPTLWRFFQDVEEMLRHPAISHPLKSFKSGIANAVFEVEGASSPVHAKFALDEAKRFWSKCLPAVQVSYEYGRGPCEVVYEREDGLLRLAGMQAAVPLTARVLVRGKEYAGVRIPSAAGQADLWGPQPGLPAKGWWRCHDRRYNRFYGFPQLYPAWNPWRRLSGRDGAQEILDGAFYRHGIAPPIGRYDAADQLPIRGSADGTPKVSNRDKMLEILELQKSGGNVALSSRRDENGNYVWDLQNPERAFDGGPLIEYCDSLVHACSLGVGWPPELTEASETGSGYSGRSIPLEVYFVGQQSIAEGMLDDWYRQIGEPLLQWNFGPGAWVRLKVVNLLESRQKAAAKTQQPEQPGDAPGAPPPKPGEGQEDDEDDEDEGAWEFGTWDGGKHPREPDGTFAEKGGGVADDYRPAGATPDELYDYKLLSGVHAEEADDLAEDYRVEVRALKRARRKEDAEFDRASGALEARGGTDAEWARRKAAWKQIRARRRAENKTLAGKYDRLWAELERRHAAEVNDLRAAHAEADEEGDPGHDEEEGEEFGTDWDESKHPRDGIGQFAEKAGVAGGGGGHEAYAALRATVGPLTGKPFKAEGFRFNRSGLRPAGDVFWSRERDYAEAFAEEVGSQGEVITSTIGLKNPLHAVAAKDNSFADPAFENPIIAQAKKEGRDGVIFESKDGQDQFFVVFGGKPVDAGAMDLLRRWAFETGDPPMGERR